MANSWLRLWHDMPNDPKFRVVAKASKQPLHLVIAVYVAMLCDASKNDMSRGVTQCHDEDIAVTVECDMSQVIEIKAAMQGRLLDGNVLSGWKNRQPLREDSGDEKTGTKSAAQRKREQRDRDSVVDNSTEENQCHELSRNVTLDKDKDKDKSNTPKPPSGADIAFETFWSAYPKKVGKDAGRKAFDKRKADPELLKTMLAAIADQSKSKQWTDDAGKYIPNPATWLNDGRWMDGRPVSKNIDAWWEPAGFDNEWEARNAQCAPSTAKFFRDGKRVMEIAA